MPELLKIDNVRKGYGEDPVLEGISFALDYGDSLSVIGPSGCGKSTLLSLIVGLLSPDHGEITRTEPKKHISFVLQDYGLFPWKTVEDNIALPLLLTGSGRDIAHERSMALISELGLTGLENRWPAELSGGQRQRVALGRALIRTPSLLLLDEPFSSLDALTRESMQDLILQLRAVHGFSYILVTHSVSEAVYLGKRILPLSFGTAQPMLDNPCFGQRPGENNSDSYARITAAVRGSLSIR